MGLKNLNYFISCREIAPTTKHPHIHIYCQFTNTQKISVKKMKGAHIEICKGTPQQNQSYIMKDGDIIDEWGDIRNSGNYTIENVKKMDRKEREELPLIYYNIVQKINEEENNQLTMKDFEKEVKVIYIHGESGIGKTQKAKELIKEYMKKNNVETFNLVKYENTFWMGVSEKSEIALYDDFRDSHMKPSEFINFIDYNIHPMNIKGGSIKNRYKYIIITSVQDPRNLYKNVQEKDDEPMKQWIRRMEILHILGTLGPLNK
jgi:Cdc6-like AAA superfamily ATPase